MRNSPHHQHLLLAPANLGNSGPGFLTAEFYGNQRGSHSGSRQSGGGSSHSGGAYSGGGYSGGGYSGGGYSGGGYSGAHSSGGGSHPGNRSFQKGQSGEPPRVPHCLVCGSRGHHARACNQKVKRDGSALFAKWNENKLVSISGNNPICAKWNASGRAYAACNSHNSAEHACSFCGRKDHHAFSWHRDCLPAA